MTTSQFVAGCRTRWNGKSICLTMQRPLCAGDKCIWDEKHSQRSVARLEHLSTIYRARPCAYKTARSIFTSDQCIFKPCVGIGRYRVCRFSELNWARCIDAYRELYESNEKLKLSVFDCLLRKDLVNMKYVITIVWERGVVSLQSGG